MLKLISVKSQLLKFMKIENSKKMLPSDKEYLMFVIRIKRLNGKFIEKRNK